ncbi:hypothetical protein NC652_026002 [Populus alba x Populus x berolinensis]|uniref:Uncharacterized protein n=1 Tax=Populus alba x Populus x berolinensis TaxID=444605 RepID=A0AAD6Q984_9ROSI|nr:hypothetical protein NC652_026002 [Populus alba x Populus x berolinensis]KAJ6982535.1 hypothetical protein NC653_025599 [Populus alba x Populus x berolinensis]
MCRPDNGAEMVCQRVCTGGRANTRREQGKVSFAFLEVKDGSFPANLHIIVDTGVAHVSTIVQTGTCMFVEGLLKVPPESTKQKIGFAVRLI